MSRSRGMTLVELMVAVSLMLALSAGVLALLWNLQRARESTESLARSTAALDRWMESVESDVLGTAVSVSGRAGLSGGEGELRVVSRRIGVGPGARTAGERVADARLTVHRVEGGRVVTVSGAVDGAGVAGEAASGVSRLRFRFLTEQGWQSSFDSLRARALPLAVEVSVWGEGSGSGEERTPAGGAGPEEAPESEGNEQRREDDGVRPDRVRVIVVPDAAGGGA